MKRAVCILIGSLTPYHIGRREMTDSIFCLTPYHIGRREMTDSIFYPTNDQLYRGYAEVVGRRLGVRIDETERLLRTLHPVPVKAYSQLVDKLAPIDRTQGRIVATMALVDMICELDA